MKTTEFIDLGLPSGILWTNENEDANYTYDEAVEQFGDNLPTIVDFAELVHYCKWAYDPIRKGMVITGPNNNSIFLPAKGKLASYWSVSLYPIEDNHAYGIFFDYNSFLGLGQIIIRTASCSVRCVKRI